MAKEWKNEVNVKRVVQKDVVKVYLPADASVSLICEVIA